MMDETMDLPIPITPMTMEDMETKACKNFVYYFCDSETTSSANLEKEGKVRTVITGALSWGFEMTKRIQARTMQSLIEKVDQDQQTYRYQTRAKSPKFRKFSPTPVMFFHNLKFDGSFIRSELRQVNNIILTPAEFRGQRLMLRYLDSLGMRSTSSIEEVTRRIEKLKDPDDLPCAILKGETFNLSEPKEAYAYMQRMAWAVVDIISNMGQLYVQYVVTSRMRVIEIRDSAKIFPTTIEQLGLEVGLPKQLGKWDYSKERSLNWKPSKNELKYFWYDIDILALAMTKFLRDEKILKWTRTSYAYKKLVDATELYLANNWNKPAELFSDNGNALYPEIKQQYKTDPKQTKFERAFPEFDMVTRSIIQPAYYGGLVYRNPINGYLINNNYYLRKPKSRYLDTGAGRVYDVNSLYPHAMGDFNMPYGKPEYGEGKYKEDENMPLYIQAFTAKFTKKKDTKNRVYVPMLPNSWSLNHEKVMSDKDLKPSRYLMKLTNIDLKNFFDNYDVTEIHYEFYYKFATCTVPFHSFKETFKDLKVKTSLMIKKAQDLGDAEMETKWKSMKSEVKRTLNAPYGRLSMNVLIEAMVVEVDIFGKSSNKCAGWDVRSGSYLPAGIFICAIARNILLAAVKAAGWRFLYCDTDSIHVAGDYPVEGLPVDSAKFGYWKVESRFTKARYVRPKTYIEQTWVYDKDKQEETTAPLVKFAGLDSDAKANIKGVTDLKYTDEREPYTGVKASKQVNGGTLIYSTEKKMTPREPRVFLNKFTNEEQKAIVEIHKKLADRISLLENYVDDNKLINIPEVDLFENLSTSTKQRIIPEFGAVSGYLDMIIEEYNGMCDFYDFKTQQELRYVEDHRLLKKDLENVRKMLTSIQ